MALYLITYDIRTEDDADAARAKRIERLLGEFLKATRILDSVWILERPENHAERIAASVGADLIPDDTFLVQELTQDAKWQSLVNEKEYEQLRRKARL